MRFAKKCAQFIGDHVEIFSGNHFIEGQLVGANSSVLFVKTESTGYAPEPQIAHVVSTKIGYIRILSE
ncbi:hypothetical protein [Paenibacillus rigui]|uniref:DUF2642 domain-containing protein n=1 Tax=Paenibacillus rigui TaxID=554312 RepID=A0A229UQC4_9BACL|nr:hypothetical protein [Paenibacillus rigui]OXM85632.1 hypothetical protein CF651_14700 [Paenibacillus rigui]